MSPQGEVLEESVMMIPDTTRRLATAWDDLSKLMVRLSNSSTCLTAHTCVYAD